LEPTRISESYNIGKTLEYRFPANPNPWEHNKKKNRQYLLHCKLFVYIGL
jgi:hypothetical protein